MKRSAFLLLAAILLLTALLPSCGNSSSSPSADDQGNAATSASDSAETADLTVSIPSNEEKKIRSAVCHLLKREGENVYQIIFKNMATTLENGELRTAFDGRAVEISDGVETLYPFLELVQHEPAVYLDAAILYFDKADGSGTEDAVWEYLLQEKEGEDTLSLHGLMRRDSGSREELLEGKFAEIPDLSLCTEVYMFGGSFLTPVYNDDKKPLPLTEWTQTLMVSAARFHNLDDLEAKYVTLQGGEYYLLYEMTDEDGNVTCSDLIYYPTKPKAPEKKEPDVSVKWKKGAREQLLFREGDVEIYLSMEKNGLGETFYALKVKNGSDTDLKVSTDSGIANGNVVMGSSASFVYADAGDAVTASSGMSFGVEDGAPEMKTLKSLTFDVEISDQDNYKAICPARTVSVDMTDTKTPEAANTALFQMEKPALDAFAKEQVLFENETLRLTLLGAGTVKYDSQLEVLFRAENLSDRTVSFDMENLILNGVQNKTYASRSVPAGCITYFSVYYSNFLSSSDLVGDSVETLDVHLMIRGTEDWILPSENHYWCSVKLDSHGKAKTESGETLWKKDDFRLELISFDDAYTKWQLLLTNGSDEPIAVKNVDSATGKDVSYSAEIVGAGQSVALEISGDGSEDNPSLAIKTQIYDLKETALLLESEEFLLQAKP